MAQIPGFLGRPPQPRHGNQFPLVADLAVVAVVVFGAGIPGEYTALPSSPSDDVVQGAAAGVVILRGLDHQPVRHAVMRPVVLDVARVVSLPEIGQNPSQDLPAVIFVVGSGMGR